MMILEWSLHSIFLLPIKPLGGTLQMINHNTKSGHQNRILLNGMISLPQDQKVNSEKYNKRVLGTSYLGPRLATLGLRR